MKPAFALQTLVYQMPPDGEKHTVKGHLHKSKILGVQDNW